MEKKLKLTAALAAVGAAAVLIVLNIPTWREWLGQRDRVVFRMSGNSSAGEFYRYEFDRDDILREVDHYSARNFISCGPGYSEVWEFEIVGEGKLTVNWTGYKGGAADDELSFYEIYLVKDGEHTRIFDSRDAQSSGTDLNL